MDGERWARLVGIGMVRVIPRRNYLRFGIYVVLVCFKPQVRLSTPTLDNTASYD